MSRTPMLRVESLSHSFGKFLALSDVSLEVYPGRLTALIGPNGAGKTTLYNAVSGRFRPTRGRVFFEGREITGRPAHKIAPLGLMRSFQITNIFPHLTVIENVLVPLVLQEGKAFSFLSSLAREKALFRRAEEVLDKVGVLAAAYRPAHALAYGDKRLVEMAVVLARQPKLVLLDEPTAGMNPEETNRMVHLIKDLAERLGTTFFLTEHDMTVVFAVAAQIFVLHQGEVLAEGDPETIRSDPRVREAYLGGSVDA